MKKFIITILALCLVQISFAQIFKSIRVNNSIQGKSWSYAISEIDSITYDSFSQLQKMYINGECKETILESVDSISFSSDEAINVVLSKDYIDNAESYVFSNGLLLTEKVDSIQGKIIMVDSIDVLQNQWSTEKSFMIYCNSTYKPIIAKNPQNIFYFEYDNNGNLIEVNATDLDGNTVYPMNANARKSAIRRVSTEGWTTGDDIGAALDLYGTVNTMYNPTKGNIAGTVASWLAKLLPQGIPQDLGGLIPSLIEALNGGKAGLLGSILGYEKLIQDIGENRARSLIGDCTPYIKSAYKEGNNSAVINVQIAGVSSNTQCTPYYLIRYWQEVNGERTNVTYTTTPVKATNGTHPVTINNLNGGRYDFQVLIFPDMFLEHGNLIGLYNFRSNIAYVDIARLHFKVLEQDYTTYADDYVKVSMKAVLDFPSEQDETILSYYDSYGVYYHYDDHVNQREDYISVKENGSLEFYVTLDIPRDEFSCDYSNFVATCADKITFKAYTIDGWGIKEFYDEQEPQIVYDKSPVAKTGDNIFVGSTAAIVLAKYENFSFWNATCGLEYQSHDNTKTIIVLPQDENEQEINLTGLALNTTYTYHAYCEINGKKKYGEMNSFETNDDYYQICPDDNHPHAIDMGTGVKWACNNMIGHCYYSEAESATQTRWGGSWRLPSLSEIKALLSNSFSIWTTQYGNNGRIFISKTTGGIIFLPAFGVDFGSYGVSGMGSSGWYWTSTFEDDDEGLGAYSLMFDSENVGWGRSKYGDKRSLRPVTEKMNDN